MVGCPKSNQHIEMDICAYIFSVMVLRRLITPQPNMQTLANNVLHNSCFLILCALGNAWLEHKFQIVNNSN